ncbi:SDR family NAD(P)-dependent oxidoreductase [Thermicanus aegyptius]|uniref:SDR family NAD(P)-dependent oxidoreductase n=1 Tax=Thermicanus aegyptius TaxID=94009 RepID=UPI0003F90697|nr:SDR family oxidoreductase [Thermicanus aegyptius]
MRFAGKKVLITGGGSGIGAAATEAFLNEGAEVAVFDVIGPEPLMERWKGKKCTVFQVDVSCAEAVDEAVRQLEKQWGVLDVLVNNAGIEFVGAIEEMSEDDWDRVLDINLKGIFLVTKSSLPMLKSVSGVIVNTASQLAIVGAPHFTAYTASKSAVLNFTRSLALEVAKYGIRVNAVCPGAVDTPLLRRQFADGKQGPQGTLEDLIRMHPLMRLGRPEEIAAAILFLSSADASFITGSALVADGGYTSW